MYAKCNRCRIHLPKNTFFPFFFLALSRSAFEMMMEKKKEKKKTLHHTGVKSSAQPEGGERIENQLILKKGRKNFFEV